MDEKDEDLVIPIIREEVHADAVPVATGGVRVTKRVESHDETLEQELRRSRVEVKRVRTDRVVDGPQPARRVGSTLIIPVVSEVLRVEKQWVVTEEIHITELQERETVQNTVTLNREEALVERIDSEGNVVPAPQEISESSNQPAAPVSILQRASTPASEKTTLGRPRSMLKNRRRDHDQR